MRSRRVAHPPAAASVLTAAGSGVSLGRYRTLYGPRTRLSGAARRRLRAATADPRQRAGALRVRLLREIGPWIVAGVLIGAAIAFVRGATARCRRRARHGVTRMSPMHPWERASRSRCARRWHASAANGRACGQPRVGRPTGLLVEPRSSLPSLHLLLPIYLPFQPLNLF
jgi:hypothetical protein